MTHHIRRAILPFTAIVGQDTMKKALILNAINPCIGGVLIRGEKGTAESTAVRALAERLPEIEVIKALEPGILAAANRGILYTDEVNLLDDHVADVILDSYQQRDKVGMVAFKGDQADVIQMQLGYCYS